MKISPSLFSRTHQPTKDLSTNTAVELHVNIHTVYVVGFVANALLNALLQELHSPHGDLLPAAVFRYFDDVELSACCHGHIIGYGIRLVGENIEVHCQSHLQEYMHGLAKKIVTGTRKYLEHKSLRFEKDQFRSCGEIRILLSQYVFIIYFPRT